MRLSRTSRICGTRCRRTRERARSARGAKPAGRCGPCATWAMPRCRIRARFSTAPRPGPMVQFGVLPHQTTLSFRCGEVIFQVLLPSDYLQVRGFVVGLFQVSGRCMSMPNTKLALLLVCRFAALLSLGLWTVAMP